MEENPTHWSEGNEGNLQIYPSGGRMKPRSTSTLLDKVLPVAAAT